MEAVLSQEVQQFLLKHIDSVAELEGLLLMRREPDERWTVPLLARRLYVSDSSAAEVVAALQRQQLVSEDNGLFRYSPPAHLKDLIDRVEAEYSRCLIPITNLLHNKRSSAAQQFADAFRIREKN